MRRRIVAIIVHYRTPEMLRDAVVSLVPELDQRTDEIVIVDNASGEADLAQIRPLGSDPALRGGGGQIQLIE